MTPASGQVRGSATTGQSVADHTHRRVSGLKATVASLGLNVGLTNALTTRLDQVLKLLDKDKSAEAIDVLSNDFIVQVNDLTDEGKLSGEQAATLVEASQQLTLYLTMSN